MRHNIISALWESFYSKDLYQDVRTRWGFNVVGYVFILALIYTLVFAIKAHTDISNFVTSVSSQVINKIPTGKIIKGNMTITESSPYSIYYQDTTKGIFAVFDMNNKVMPDQSKAAFIFHSNGYYYRNDKHEDYTFHAYPLKNITFSSEQVQKIAHKFLIILP